MGMSDLRNSRFYQSCLRYQNINDSSWYNSIAQYAKGNSHRNENRIEMHFASEENFKKAVEECERRNISYVDGPHTVDYAKDISIGNGITVIDRDSAYIAEWRIDIFMNWKENKPSRAHRNKDLILD